MKVSHQSRIFATLAALVPPRLLGMELCGGAAEKLTENVD